MNKTYETMVLLDNREVKKGWDALKGDVSGLFEKHEAKVVSARRWQERRLAYPMNGQQRATYLLVYHATPSEGLAAIDRELRYSDVVLRHMTTACEEVPAEAHEPEAEFDPDAIPEDDAPPEPEAPAEEAKAEEKTEDKPAEGEAKSEDGKAEEAKAEDGAEAPAESSGEGTPEAEASSETKEES